MFARQRETCATRLMSAFHAGFSYWVRDLATYAEKTLILRCFMLKLRNILEKYGEKINFFKKNSRKNNFRHFFFNLVLTLLV